VGDLRAIGVDDGDVDVPGAAPLRDRLTQPKPLTLVPVSTWTGIRNPSVASWSTPWLAMFELAHGQPDRTPGVTDRRLLRQHLAARGEVAAECRRRGLSSHGLRADPVLGPWARCCAGTRGS